MECAVFCFDRGAVKIHLACLRVDYSEALQAEFDLACLMFQYERPVDIAAAVIPIVQGWLVSTDITCGGGHSYQGITVDKSTDNEAIDFALILSEIMSLVRPIDTASDVVDQLNKLDRRERQAQQAPASEVVDTFLAQMRQNPS